MRLHKLSSTFISLLALAILAAGSVFGAAPTFGMVGLGLGQTLRLNVVAYPPTPCSAMIGFRDSNGNAPQPQPDKTVTLQPGQADFLDINANTLISAAILPQVNSTGARNRISLRPVVTLTNPGVGACVVTAEVIDNLTAFSVLAVVPQPQPDSPQPQPDFGMAGIALGQILRINIVAFPPTPCSATIGFRGNNNIPQPEPDKTVTLQPGQADFLDISAASLGVQFGHRVELRPVVTVLQTISAASSAPSACSATVEVYDPITGRTWAFQPMPLPDLPAVQSN